MVHLTTEIKDNIDQVLNTTRLFGKPYQKEKIVQAKTKVEKNY
jgi:cbb3-type cytochrome oxidase cytochrome c subunit